jgi:rhodanese-related sulfurtransferase
MNDLPLEISVQEAAVLLDNQPQLRLIDVREDDEYAICKIEGSQLVPLSNFAELVPGALGEPSGEQILVYCHHGARSLRAANYLRQKGYTGAQSVAGGIDQWSLQVDPEVPRY